jgi:DNA-binding response OmpR family regulator
MRILIVDDALDFAQALADALIDGGHHVTVDDGSSPLDEVLAVIRSSLVDVVLLDLGLGASRGVPLIEALNAAPARPAIVLCTGAANTEVEPLRALIDGVLYKPFDLNKLFAAIDALSRRGDPGNLAAEGRVPEG